jgi:hypothetical protein
MTKRVGSSRRTAARCITALIKPEKRGLVDGT